MKIRIAFDVEPTQEELNAIARALGRSVSATDLANLAVKASRAELVRLVEHGLRGLDADRKLAVGEIEVGRPAPPWPMRVYG